MSLLFGALDLPYACGMYFKARRYRVEPLISRLWVAWLRPQVGRDFRLLPLNTFDIVILAALTCRATPLLLAALSPLPG